MNPSIAQASSDSSLCAAHPERILERKGLGPSTPRAHARRRLSPFLTRQSRSLRSHRLALTEQSSSASPLRLPPWYTRPSARRKQGICDNAAKGRGCATPLFPVWPWPPLQPLLPAGVKRGHFMGSLCRAVARQPMIIGSKTRQPIENCENPKDGIFCG